MRTRTTTTTDRRFPFKPRTTRQLRVGDFWAVRLSGGRFGCLQVVDLRETGVASRKALVAGVVDWVGPAPPLEGDLAGRRVLAQGMVRIEALTESDSEIAGNTDQTLKDSIVGDNPFRDHHVGARTYTWGWKILPAIVESTLSGDGRYR